MGEKLKAARRAAGLSQAQLAEAVGCLQKDISRYESGKHEPRALTLKKMAEILGCAMEELV